MAKRVFLIAVLLGTVFLVAGCGTQNLVPVVGPDQNTSLIWVDGRQAALSQTLATSVAVSGVRTDNKFLFLHVGYRNTGTTLADANPDAIRVEAMNSAGVSEYLHVYSADDYLKQVRDSQSAALFAQAIGAALDAHRAGHRTTVTRTSTHYWGPGGYSSFWGATTVTQTYDSGRAVGATIHNAWELARTAREYRDYADALDAAMLRHTTLYPGQVAEGLVVVEFDPHFHDRLWVTTPIGDDIHETEFVLR